MTEEQAERLLQILQRIEVELQYIHSAINGIRTG